MGQPKSQEKLEKLEKLEKMEKEIVLSQIEDFLSTHTLSKPFYKQRRFWLLLSLGGVAGAGISIALPFIAANLVGGIVTSTILIAGVTGGWAVIAAAGLVAGIIVAGLAFALVKGISAALKSNPQSKPQQNDNTITPATTSTSTSQRAADKPAILNTSAAGIEESSPVVRFSQRNKIEKPFVTTGTDTDVVRTPEDSSTSRERSHSRP